MSQLRGFFPWIVFSAVSGLVWSWAALLSLALGALFLAKDRRAGVPADAQILEFGAVGYFGVLTAVAFVDPHAPVRDYASGLSSAWLALIAAVTLLVRRPFVLGIAKRRTPQAVWGSPVFRRTCGVLTGVWAVGFALSAVATLACEAVDSGMLSCVGAQIVGLGLPVVFTRFYVKGVRERVSGAGSQEIAAGGAGATFGAAPAAALAASAVGGR
ncbi:hypothetical protein [Actinacidiphila sp. bgisy144]|uniref:hypothetical protein n=1 Tax=Actinacidiphila sp. bgisy144 TaxID=3413791 RepID=UPI003EB6B5B3